VPAPRSEDLGSTNNRQEFRQCNKSKDEIIPKGRVLYFPQSDSNRSGRPRVLEVKRLWLSGEDKSVVFQTPETNRFHAAVISTFQLEGANRRKRYSNLVQLCSNLSCGFGGIIICQSFVPNSKEMPETNSTKLQKAKQLPDIRVTRCSSHC